MSDPRPAKRVAVLALLALAGCDFPSTEYGQPLTEQATVVDLPYVPAGHGSGSGIGMSMSGNMVVTSNNVHIPERMAVVFECQHGRFVIEGNKALWQKLKVGQRVTVSYREVFRVTKAEGRQLADLDFLDATP